MKSILVIPFALAILSIPQDFSKENIPEKPKTLDVVNSSGEMYQKWQAAVMKLCVEETNTIAYTMLLANQDMTENDFNKLKNMLLFSCSKHYNIAF